MRRYSGFLAVAILVSPASTRPAQAVPQIVVESKCASGASYVEGGTGWGNSSAKSNKTPCSGGSRSTKDAAAFVEFIPTIVTEGPYDVYATWGLTTSSNAGPNADNVQVSIIDRDGTQTAYMDMRGHASCPNPNSNQLLYLGRGYFKVNQGHKVRLSNTSSNQCYNGASKRFVNADALLFSYADLVPTLPLSWGKLKIIYRN